MADLSDADLMDAMERLWNEPPMPERVNVYSPLDGFIALEAGQPILCARPIADLIILALGLEARA